jgi:UDP:flavonoid glycosyltransferase YjiC (YdhE family)
MRILLACLGALGDTQPFVSLAKILTERGHSVVVLGNGYYQAGAEKQGVVFKSILEAEEFADILLRQSTISSWKRTSWGLRKLMESMPMVYDLLAELHQPGNTVVAAQPWVFGARVAQEQLGLPLATVNLQPILFGLLGPGKRRFPVLKRALDRGADIVSDLILARKINAYRARFGLAPARQILRGWCLSPQLVIDFFPPWFAQPQGNWPDRLILPGFPLEHDDRQTKKLTADVEAFLRAGDPPLVFCQSSFWQDEHFFTESVALARRLGQRAILLSSDNRYIPESLPEEIRYFGFVPLAALLPRSAALIHRGGIGTVALALRAGVPQMTVPLKSGQADICRHLARLGVSAHVPLKRYRADIIAPQLEALLHSKTVKRQCRRFAEMCRNEMALVKACEALESLGAEHRSTAEMPTAKG